MALAAYYFYRLIKRYYIKRAEIYVKYIHKTFYSLRVREILLVPLFLYTGFIIGDCKERRNI